MNAVHAINGRPGQMGLPSALAAANASELSGKRPASVSSTEHEREVKDKHRPDSLTPDESHKNRADEWIKGKTVRDIMGIHSFDNRFKKDHTVMQQRAMYDPGATASKSGTEIFIVT